VTLTLPRPTGDARRVAAGMAAHRYARGVATGVTHRNADADLAASRLGIRHLLLAQGGSVVAKSLVEVQIGTSVRVSYVVSHIG